MFAIYVFCIILVNILSIVKSQSKDYFCQTFSSSSSGSSSTCSVCKQGFTLSTTLGLCVSNCQNNLFYEQSSQSCVGTCNYNEIGNTIQNGCQQIYQCPILADMGQDFHSGSATSLIVDNSNTDITQRILISISSSDKTIKLWNLQTGQLKTTFYGHTQPILKVFLLSNLNQLLSFSSNGEIFFWNYQTGQLVSSQTVTLGQLTPLSAIDLNLTILTLYGFQGEFFTYNYSTNTSYKYIGHTNIVLNAILVGSSTIITYSLDKSIILWTLSQSSYTFEIICSHSSTPGGFALINFTVNSTPQSYLFSFGTSGTDSQNLSISNLSPTSTANKQCQTIQTGDFTQPILNVLVDASQFSVIGYSSVEIVVYGYNLSGSQFILLQKINSIFTTLSFLPISGIYINQSNIALYTSTGQYILTTYSNQNQSLQSTQQQSIIKTSGLITTQLSRNDIRGSFIDVANGMLYFYGSQIQQVNIVTLKLNYIINNLSTPFIQNTQTVVRVVTTPAQNILAATSYDGLSLTYDFTKGEMIQSFYHPSYVNSQTQPQGQTLCLVQGSILCVYYSDQSVVCFNAINKAVLYNQVFSQPVLRLFNEDTNGYLIVNTLDYLYIINPPTQQTVNSVHMAGQFYYMNFYQNFNCMTVTIGGNAVRFNYPQLTVKYQFDASSINTSSANIIGFAFEPAFEGYSVFFFIDGLTILYDQSLNVLQTANDNVQINRVKLINLSAIYFKLHYFFQKQQCGIIKSGSVYLYYTCLNQDGTIIAHGIGANSAFYFKQQIMTFPITQADVVPQYNKAFFIINLGSYGGAAVFADASTLLGQSQFNTPYTITKYTIDTTNQRVFLPNTGAQIMVSHFVPNTNVAIKKNETSTLQQLLLIKSQQKLVILSNVITIYDYFAQKIIMQNSSVFKSAIKNALIIEDLYIIISYNADTSNNLQIWNYSSNQIQPLPGHSSGINGVQFIESANLLISYDQGGLIKVWNYNQDLTQIQSALNINQHNTNSIINLQIFNSYTSLFISFDVLGNVFITNYMNGNIIKAFQVSSMNQMIIDFINDRIFLYGTNIAVYSTITGAKLSDLIGFDNQVQNVILKNNYIIAYGSVVIQSFQRDTLTLLYTSKFKNTIYSLAVLKNLVGMVGNNVDNTIELWDYTNGNMLSNIVSSVYNQNFTSIFVDEDSELFIVQNSNRMLFTVTPFITTSYSQVKDFLLTTMTTSLIKNFVFDFVSNKLIVCNNDQIVIWNYYAFLGYYGQAYFLPSNSQIKAAYQTQQDLIAYTDLEKNVWYIQNNQLTYQSQLLYIPQQLKLHTNTFITSDGTNLYSYDMNFNQKDQHPVYPYKIYLDESIPYIFVQTYSYTIIQFSLDVNTSLLTSIKTYTNHSNRIVGCIIDITNQHILTHDVTGFLAINNYSTQLPIVVPQQHTGIIRAVVIDSQYNRLLTCSADMTSTLFSYNGDSALVVEQVFTYKSTVVSGLIDTQLKQILIWSDLQQIVEVRDLTTQTLNNVKYIYGPGDYMIQLKLSSQFSILAIFNPFQINLHDRSNNDALINSLRQPSHLYDIQDIKFISSSLLLVVSQSQLDLVRFSSTAISIEKSFSMQYSTILSFNYADSLILNIKGVNLQTVFNYTLPYANDPSQVAYSQCYSNLQRTDSYFLLDQDLLLQSNSLLKLSQTISGIVLNIQMSSQQNFFFVPMNTNFASTSGSVQQYYVYNRKQSISSNIVLSFTSFLSFTMPTLTLKNFQWQIIDSQVYTFSSLTKNIMFTSSLFVNDITGTQFVMNNINTLMIDSMKINNLKMYTSPPQLKNRRLASSTQSISLFSISNSAYVYINNLVISNISIQNSFTLFEFINVEYVIIENLTITNVNYFISSGTQDQWSSLFSIQNCQNVQILSVTIKDCTQYAPSSSSSFTYSKFNIFSMQANKQITINTLTATNVQYLMLFNISQIYLQSKIGYFQVINDQVTFNSVTVDSSSSVPGSPFNQVSSDNLSIINSTFQTITCLQSQGCAFYLQSTYFTISRSTFQDLKAQYGGAICIKNSPQASLIDKSKFIQNSSVQGGALYLDGSNLQITQTVITLNSAQVGGAIRYLNLIPDFIIQKQIISQNTFKNKVFNNQAKVFGQNVCSYLRQAQIQSTNSGTLFKQITNSNQNGVTYELNTFMSGDSSTFNVELFDEEGGRANLNELSTLDLIFQEELELYTLECISTNTNILISGNKADYNQTSVSFSFTDILIIAQPSSSQSFYISNNFLKLPDPNNPTQFLSESHYIQIHVNFRECQLGEIFIKSSSNSPAYCQKCPFQKYSLVLPDPNNSEQQVCSLCPSECEYCEGSTLILLDGYWRENNYTDVIVSCDNNPSNCLGESSGSVNNCKEGYVGPLCEQCDLFGKVWNKTYMNKALYNCVPCQQSESLVLMYIVSVLIGCLYFIFGIRSAVIMTRIKVQSYYLRMIGLASIGNSDSTDQSDIYLKFLVHFIQISTIVYQIDIPSFLFMFQVSVGTPIDALKYSQDCKSIFAADIIPPVYGRIIWSQLIPIGYSVFLLALYFALYSVKYFVKIDKKLIITGAIFMLIFLQPNIISGLVSIIACRSIGGKQYITADVSMSCGTEQYYKFNAILFLPLFLIWAVIIPFYWIICLYQRRNKLNYCTVRLAYGFLYQEYKHSQYYWEFLKIYLKLIIIFVSTIFSQQISVKSTLCTLVLFGYLILSLFKAPYNCITFNRTDQYMCIVLIACLQINIFVNISQNELLASIGRIFLFVINYMFMGFLIFSVLIGKTKRYLMIFGKRFPILRYKLSYVYLKLGISQYNKMKTFKNWSLAIKLIREHLIQHKTLKSMHMNAVKSDKNEVKSNFQISTYREHVKTTEGKKRTLSKQGSNHQIGQLVRQLSGFSNFQETDRKRDDTQFTIIRSECDSFSPNTPVEILKKYGYTDESEASPVKSSRRTPLNNLSDLYQFNAKSNVKNSN